MRVARIPTAPRVTLATDAERPLQVQVVAPVRCDPPPGVPVIPALRGVLLAVTHVNRCGPRAGGAGMSLLYGDFVRGEADEAA